MSLGEETARLRARLRYLVDTDDGTLLHGSRIDGARRAFRRSFRHLHTLELEHALAA